MSDDDLADYDFSDWELDADDADVLRNVVRRNLAAQQKMIQAGRWCLREWDSDLNPLPPHRCEMEWKWGPNWFEELPLLALRPAQLAAVLIEELQIIADRGMYKPAGDKDELRDYWQRVTAGWRAALDAVDEEAKRLLDK